MKYTTVVFRDNLNRYYIGEKENDVFIGFKHFQVTVDPKDSAYEALRNLKLNEFLIVDVEAVSTGYRITPLTVGSLSANTADGAVPNGVAPEIYEIQPLEKVLEIFNSVLSPKQEAPKPSKRKKKTRNKTT
jgi:hypothetical protein